MAPGALSEPTRAALARVAVAFACGALGGAFIGMGVPLAAALHVTDFLGVAIHPQLTAAFLYSKVVWGGIWGPLLLVPTPSLSPAAKGCLLGALGPGLTQLLIVFPLKETPGSVAGLTLGALTPLLVLFFNAVVWGMPACLALAALTPAAPTTAAFTSLRPLGSVVLDPEDPESKFS